MDKISCASADTSLPATKEQNVQSECTADGTGLMSDAVIVRPLRRDEVTLAHQMLANEWPSIPSLSFHYALHDSYPGGWLCATIGDSIVGMLFFAKFPDGSGFAGSFLVKKEYRKQGVGCRLRDALAAHFSDANLGISGLEQRADSFVRSGYRVRSFGIRVYSGQVNVAAAVARLAVLRQQDALTTSGGDPITLSEVRLPSEELLSYDAEINRVRRDAFVTQYIGLPESYTLAAVRHDGTVVGYGTLHRGVPSYLCAPVYADDEHVAELILMSLLVRLTPEDSLYWIIPTGNTAVARFAELLGQRQLFDFVRLYTRCDVPLPLHKIYGFATRNASFA